MHHSRRHRSPARVEPGEAAARSSAARTIELSPPAMTFAIWALIIGLLLIAMVLSGTLLKRLPLSNAMLYLAAGFALGPTGLGSLDASA